MTTAEYASQLDSLMFRCDDQKCRQALSLIDAAYSSLSKAEFCGMAAAAGVTVRGSKKAMRQTLVDLVTRLAVMWTQTHC